METRVNRAANAIAAHHSTPRQRARTNSKDPACRGWSVCDRRLLKDDPIHGNRSMATDPWQPGGGAAQILSARGTGDLAMAQPDHCARQSAP